MFSLDKLVWDDDEPAWSYVTDTDYPEGFTRRVYTFNNGYQASVVLGLVPNAPDTWEIAVLHNDKIVETPIYPEVFRVPETELHDTFV